MTRALSVIFLLLSFHSVFSQNTQKPKLVVGIVVDQMRQEFLVRFSDHFGEGGFKRIQNEGFEMKNAHYNYVPTETGPGHSSIYTGSTPRYHGIISNHWYSRELNKGINCVEDDSVQPVGGKDRGNRSPKNLLTTTLTDELKISSLGQSRVISISIKDRGAILPGGKNSDGSYWYDHESGGFMTSTYYTSELPKWVKDFNGRKLADKYLSLKWETIKPIESYVESERDDRPYEKPIHESVKPVFPYDLKAISKKGGGYGMLPSTPFGNTLVTEMALAALGAENLGQGSTTDFLAISYSSPDYIGHKYGPMSKEIQDTYIRLDLELARLFAALDEQVGEGNWSLFLTSDHGVSEIPHGLLEKKMAGGYFSQSEVESGIREQAKILCGSDEVIEHIHDNQIYLNHAVIDENKKPGELNKLIKVIKDYLIQLDGVAGVYDTRDAFSTGALKREVKMLQAGLNQKRSGDIVFFLQPGWLKEWYAESGTGHGSHYTYDTHVPMIFYGAGINAGSSLEYHPITNVAPTMAILLGLKLPSGCTGQPVSEVLAQP